MQNNNAPDTAGYDAINAELERAYGKTEIQRFVNPVFWELGGKDFLKEVAVLDCGDYFHFVTYGLSDVYDLFEKGSERPEYSGFGYEMTFKLKKDCYENEKDEINNFCNILNLLADYTNENREIFRSFEYLETGQERGFDSKGRSALTGFIFVPNTSLNTVDTPNGKVMFTELVGMTKRELDHLTECEYSGGNIGEAVGAIYKKLGTDITDLCRKSLI